MGTSSEELEMHEWGSPFFSEASFYG